MARPGEVVSHWHHSVENFNTSTLEFFIAIEGTLNEKLAPVKMDRVDYRESGILSDKRQYLRVSYARYSFDIGAAPFGKDFFFSWWLVRRLPDASLMMGCLGIIGVPIAYFILAKLLGVFFGFVALIVIVGGLLAAAMNNAGDMGMKVEDAILSLPLIGSLYRRFVRPITYYSEDSRKMFEETVHRIVLQHVTGLLSVAKMPPLSPEESKQRTRKAFD
jgi:hypothetical protein